MFTNRKFFYVSYISNSLFDSNWCDNTRYTTVLQKKFAQ